MRALKAAAVAALGAALAWSPVSAEAAESTWPTAQAVAAHAEWVPYLDPPPKPAAICLVDSGVNITPDTPPDSPNGPILERSALDGGPGTGGTDDIHSHGTYMAMTAGAPMNGWGTVGIWPGVRIVSVRAMPAGAETFAFDNYQRALSECAKRARVANIAIANLSIGCSCIYDEANIAILENRIADVHRANMSVSASVGNSSGDVAAPAAVAGVLGVAAGAPGGALCSFSNRGQGVDLIAPGCDLDGAWPTTGRPFVQWIGGTSPAAVEVSSLIALIRSYRPDLDWQATEALVQRTSQPAAAGASIDFEAAFRAAGLIHELNASKARALEIETTPASLSPSSDVATTARPEPEDRSPDLPVTERLASVRTTLATPRFRLVRRKRQLLVIALNRPQHANVVVRLDRRVGEFAFEPVSRRRSNARTTVLAFPRRRQGRVMVRFERLGTRSFRSRPAYQWVRR
jgi:hypothetical protein